MQTGHYAGPPDRSAGWACVNDGPWTTEDNERLEELVVKIYDGTLTDAEAREVVELSARYWRTLE